MTEPFGEARTELQRSYLRAVESARQGDDVASRMNRQSLTVVALGVPELEPLIPSEWLPLKP